MDDAVTYRPFLNCVFDELDFNLPPVPEVLPSFTNPETPPDSYVEPLKFGEERRKHDRRTSLKQAIADENENLIEKYDTELTDLMFELE